MKNTVLFRIEDDFKIVVGFGHAVIDPMETEKIIGPKIKDLPEYKKSFGKADEIKTARKLWSDKFKESRAFKISGNQIAYERANLDLKEIDQKLKNLVSELTALNEEFMASRLVLMESNAVYFTPRSGENVISDAEFEKYGEVYATRKNETDLVCLDFSTVENNRGQRWFKLIKSGWEFGLIEKLGDKKSSGAIWETELTDDQRIEIGTQFEIKRIAGLSTEDREAEKMIAIESAKHQAIDYRSKLELESGASAMGEAQRYYANLLAAVDAKYK